MNEAIISEAQDYLTVEKDEGYRRIVDIQNLLQSHSTKEVIDFLKDYLKGKEQALRNLILIDKTHRRIDQYVSAMFRITMAIKTLEEGEEVKIIEISKQGAKESGGIHKRNSGGNNGTRSRKNRSHDAENRPARNQQHVPPESILGLTFTRNAAEEMRQRLVPVLKEQASRVTLSTIHSFAHYLLRNEGKLFEIISGKDQLSFIKNLMKHKKLKDLSVGSVLREISLAKNNLIGVEEFRCLYESDKNMLKVADIYEAYDREKAKKYLLDFDDLLLETYLMLSTNNNIRDKYADRYQHLLVDEFQDTNPVQLEIIKCLIDDKGQQ